MTAYFGELGHLQSIQGTYKVVEGVGVVVANRNIKLYFTFAEIL
jgi:hypothetical protein